MSPILLLDNPSRIEIVENFKSGCATNLTTQNTINNNKKSRFVYTSIYVNFRTSRASLNKSNILNRPSSFQFLPK